jgi:hypothetical protein
MIFFTTTPPMMTDRSMRLEFRRNADKRAVDCPQYTTAPRRRSFFQLYKQVSIGLFQLNKPIVIGLLPGRVFFDRSHDTTSISYQR